VSPSRFRSRLIAVDFIAFFSVGDMVTELPAISSEEFCPCFPGEFHYFEIIPILPLQLSCHATNIPMLRVRNETRNEKGRTMTTDTQLSEGAKNVLDDVCRRTVKCRGKDRGKVKARISLDHIKTYVIAELSDAGLVSYRCDTIYGDGYAATAAGFNAWIAVK
jgi:hypothetical protein